MHTVSADVLVLGAGIAGASAAYELALTHRVLLLERETHPGMHATGRSAAIFTETYGNAVVRGLTRATRSFLFQPPQGFAQVPLVAPRSVLYVARPGETDLLRAMLDDPDMRTHTRPLSAKEALALVPVLRPECVAEALLEPGATDIDVDALHQGFLRGARTRNCEIVCGVEARSIERGNKGWCVRTDEARYEAPVLVNAAGAWADTVAGLAGVPPLGIAPLRRTAVLIDPPAGHDIRAWPLTIGAGEAFYFKPDAGRILLTPADETPSPPCDAQPEEIDVAGAVDKFESMTTHQVRRIVRKWAGLRSFAPDRTPVVGFDPAAENFFWLAGQGGYGMQTSSSMACAAASLIRGEDLPGHIRAEGVTAADLSPARLRTSLSG